MEERLIDDIFIEKDQTLDGILHQVLNQSLVIVGAEAGSLMLVDDNRGILQIKARLGKPRKKRKTEPIYQIGEDSIAGYAALTKKSYICYDIKSDTHFTPSKSGVKSFSSLLAVPIIHDNKVLAVINADSEYEAYFTKEHIKRMELIADKVSGPINERISIIEALSKFGVELTRLPRLGAVDTVLEKISELAIRSLGADIVIVYQYIQDRDEFPVEGKGPSTGGDIKYKEPMMRKIYKGDVPWAVVKQRRPGFFPDVYKEDFLKNHISRPGEKDRPRFIERENIKSMAALLLPNRAAEDHSEEVVGVMFANYKSAHEFNIDEMTALGTFADYAAAAIMNARREEQRRNQLKAISFSASHRIGNHLTKYDDIEIKITREIENTNSDIEFLTYLKNELSIATSVIKNTVKEFTRFGKPITLHKTLVNINEIINNEKWFAKPPLGINIFFEYDDNIPLISLDSARFAESMKELIRNSIRVIVNEHEGKGNINLISELINVENDESKRKNEVKIIIQDDGPGFKKDFPIFDPFQTTNPNSTGLGLATVKENIEAHGGRIEHMQNKDGGARFEIILPIGE